ncbi:hypothetical protein AMES_7960 [Amycolatopsis mediterranei S699]|uniref:DUF6745 domain-containing protein n=2 Tax=Amycolatopsis mediterranei TaxID=33910 RepID=A0A0H3DFZ9_AMYMU|nr:hypothetical protein [Amycolatopsis mediterranei]ADJ49785.1 conserved hypothetical protein [Amycolatopsis mediterranei U32]AEK46771.1 hypothetical protein RAM_41520 [Amycolatopsis mediterranei S699]AFO81493.1 hypothetical protein AMES_7960 [Amycolatopsis mediterranei S699]AGT88622.1 hypothetical protein B737_7961 [Amycolatopsis mediterranei RB]KDO07967.1 hypothetical protein DV26_27155 [Amycolatopsis mediterranei]
MSASRRPGRPLPDLSEWLNHAFSTYSANRPAAEDAITRLYALLGEPPPRFVWALSPNAAVPPSVSVEPVEARLATRVAALRRRWGDISLEARQAVKESVAGLIRSAIPRSLGLHWYGQQDAYWVTPDSGDPELELWATLVRSCGWWWPRDGLCVVAERPLVLHTDDEHRLHDASGPAVVYPDGWSVHAWHGTRVPSWVIEDPTADRINREFNVEVRRCAVEHLGWTAYIEQAGLRILSRAPDPGNPGCELQLYDLPSQKWHAPSRLLLAVNGSVERDGTRRRYGLRVPAEYDHPLDAAGWSYGLTGAQYARLQRRT